MDLQDMAPYNICCELDKLCPGYWFTFTGLYKMSMFHVYVMGNHNDELARFVVDEDNPLEYVLTKIILQFAGGTTNA